MRKYIIICVVLCAFIFDATSQSNNRQVFMQMCESAKRGGDIDSIIHSNFHNTDCNIDIKRTRIALLYYSENIAEALYQNELLILRTDSNTHFQFPHCLEVISSHLKYAICAKRKNDSEAMKYLIQCMYHIGNDEEFYRCVSSNDIENTVNSQAFKRGVYYLIYEREYSPESSMDYLYEIPDCNMELIAIIKELVNSMSINDVLFELLTN